MVHDEIKKHQRNIFMMWFDYKKAFDSVPHDWIIKALELAHVPRKLINTIMKLWAAKLHLHTSSGTLETNIIQYLTGVMQGDCLSLSLFILSINPLSFLLKKLPSYKIGPPRNRNHKISHLYYAQDRKVAKLQLDLITTFSNDISMQFGNDKCAYLYIEKGNV